MLGNRISIEILAPNWQKCGEGGLLIGTVIIRKENFEVCLSLSFHNELVDTSNRKETRPRRTRIQFKNLIF